MASECRDMLVAGRRIRIPRFLSTSSNRSVAEQHCPTLSEDIIGVFLTIEIPESFQGARNVSEDSVYKDEDETLFVAWSQFEVLSVNFDITPKEVHLRALDKYAVDCNSSNIETELNYKPEILGSGILEKDSYMSRKPSRLHLTAKAHGHDHSRALEIVAHNESPHEATFDIPKGVVLRPRVPGDRGYQNLVLQEAQRLTVAGRTCKTFHFGALCGNMSNRSPKCNLAFTDVKFECDLSDQHVLWGATEKFKV